ncbi:MAG: cobyrinate a,c-diamide synthase, partial [Nitrospirae bacterium]|nr:cobyrinate a,c-diamide synthase [Nitrospirota bacterium]
HYSEITEESLSGSAAPSAIYSVRDSEGRDKGGEGYRFGNTLASYIHIHFGSNPAAACEFVDFAERKG